MSSNKKVLIISVGSSPEQTIKSIEFNRPEYIIFFCSRDTYKITNGILRALPDNIKVIDNERIVTDNHEDITKCYRVVSQGVPRILSLWNMTFEDVAVDYTGGTKAMTAALVLATITYCNRYSYIGGERNKGGIGTVINGREVYYFQTNPWDEMAINELGVIDSLFEKARYSAVMESLQKIKDNVDERLKDIYVLLSNISEAYYHWDCFRHRQAKNIFNQSIPKLEKYRILNNSDLDFVIDSMKQNHEWLNLLSDELFNNRKESENIKGFRMLCIDLISNAVRRAEKENKYDDAVARLYSAIEKLAKAYLFGFGIDNSKTTEDQIPESLKKEFEKYKDYNKKEKKYYYKYGFNASCKMLCELDADFRERFNKNKSKLEDLMKIRNDSVLAHGIAPVSEDLYKRMLEITLDFAQIDRSELIQFPTLNMKKWVCYLIRV